MVKYKPMTQKEDEASGLLPVGEYNAKLVDIQTRFTQAGNEMWNLRFHVLRQGYEKPYIVFGKVIPDHESNFCRRMFRHLALACGRESLYESGQLEATHFEGCTLIIRIAHEPDDTGKIWPRVVDFLTEFTTKKDSATPQTTERPWDSTVDAASGGAPGYDKEIPF